MHVEDMVIIGAGPAGCAAAVQSVRLGIQPRLFDQQGRAGGLICNAFRIENYPGLERPLSGIEFAQRMIRDLDRFKIEVIEGQVRTVCLDSDGCLSLDLSGGRLRALSVVLAVGTMPRKASFPGEDELAGRGLFYEVRELLERRPGKVIVVGSGEAAFDYALSLAAAGSQVRILIRGTEHRAGPRLASQVQANPRISASFGHAVAWAEAAQPGIVMAVDGRREAETVHADAVVVAVGRTSRAEALLDPSALTIDSSPTDECSGTKTVTSWPGLYMVGDARLGGLGQLGIAVGDGISSAMQAARWLDKRRRQGPR